MRKNPKDKKIGCFTLGGEPSPKSSFEPISGGFLYLDMSNNRKKGLNMKNKNVAQGNGQNVKKSNNRITPELLQRMFLDIAQRECDETLQSF
jgi:hypothetical protein